MSMFRAGYEVSRKPNAPRKTGHTRRDAHDAGGSAASETGDGEKVFVAMSGRVARRGGGQSAMKEVLYLRFRRGQSSARVLAELAPMPDTPCVRRAWGRLR